MAFEFARAFVDLHHLATQTTYDGLDFPLIQNDGSGNMQLHPDLDTTVYTDWDLTQSQLEGIGFLAGFANRTQNIAGNQNFDFGAIKRLGYLIMGRDSSTGEIDPTWALRSPSQGDQLVIDVDGSDSSTFPVGDGNRDSCLFGGMFCTDQGLPKTVTLFGNTVIAVGFIYDRSTGKLHQVATMKPMTYPSSEVNTVFDDFIENITFEGTLGATPRARNRIIFDLQSDTIAELVESENIEGPFQVDPTDISVLENNDLIPMCYGNNSNNVTTSGGVIDFDWDIFYRNK